MLHVLLSIRIIIVHVRLRTVIHTRCAHLCACMCAERICNNNTNDSDREEREGARRRRWPLLAATLVSSIRHKYTQTLKNTQHTQQVVAWSPRHAAESAAAQNVCECGMCAAALGEEKEYLSGEGKG